jgi:hypothetical protein
MKEQDEHHLDERQFFVAGTSVEGVLNAAHALGESGTHLYGVALTTSGALGERLSQLLQGRGRLRGFKVTSRSSGLFLVEAPHRTDEGKQTGLARAYMWQQQDSDLCYFLTCQERDLFDFLLDSVHSYLQPHLCRLFLRTPQIEHSLRSVAKDYPNTKIRVIQYVARKWRESRAHAGHVDTTVEYCDEDYAAVFQKLEADGKWLSSLRLKTNGANACSGRLARDSTFSCTTGFKFFFSRFVGTVAVEVLAQRQLYRDRSRINSPSKASKPLKIIYKSGIFADKKNNYRLIRALEDCPNSALSVFHPNPYLSASFIDYADGSSYSILVSTSTGIMITPERKATTQSLARLCEYICDNFEEGDVVEFTPHDG